MWWGTTERAARIPASFVSIVYDHLAEIVEKTAEAFPKADIMPHFQFFISQAKD